VSGQPAGILTSSPRQYVPRVGELVIGTVHHSAAESYFVTLSSYTSSALLPHLAFESATKKTRPILAAGALVYARVSLAHRHMDAELECVSAATGKADGLGPLTGGMLFSVSLGMARRLMMPRGSGLVVLEELGDAGLEFETATGRNGAFWVNSEIVKTVIVVGRAVQETDEKSLGVEEQKKLVRKLIKDLS
jgi:exosome complex component RRP40